MKITDFIKRLFAFAIDIVLFYLAGRIAGFHDSNLALLWVLYETAYVSQMNGSTVGKMQMGLRVVTSDRQPVPIFKAFVRALVKIISTVFLFLGDLWMLKDEKKLTWHDKVVGTIVVEP